MHPHLDRIVFVTEQPLRIDALRDELVFSRALAEMAHSVECSKSNHDENIASSAPERAACMSYRAPQPSAMGPQAFDSK